MRRILLVVAIAIVIPNLMGCETMIRGGNAPAAAVVEHGSLDLDHASIPASPAGHYTSISTTLTPNDVCSTKTIFGIPGAATCGATFASLVSSALPHDPGVAQLSLQAAASSHPLPAGYREIPDILKDDDGNDVSSPRIRPTFPTVVCGSTQNTISARIADCAAKNGSNAVWDGTVNGIKGESHWSLVTVYDVDFQIWRDDSTNLLWPRHSHMNANWCVAAGNAQSNDPSNYCNNNSYQNQAGPTSVCVEAAGLNPAIAGENWSTGVYSYLKGYMGKIASATSPSVYWRLPSQDDYLLAYMHGYMALSDSDGYLWTSTVYASARSNADRFDPTYGPMGPADRTVSQSVRCVGRY